VSAVSDAQVPAAGTLNIDHIAHFVPDIDKTGSALEKLGFTLTPFSPQSHRPDPAGPLVPAGTGNRCVMLERGYLEFLAPTADTPVANQLRAAIARYTGVHLIALGTANAAEDHARLARAGFDPLPPLALQRPIGIDGGEDTARFTVVRVPPGTMAEGRIQYCQQHTPHLLWQERWVRHRNAATGLAAVIVCVADPHEAALRYARFTGIDAVRGATGWEVRTARGVIVIAESEAVLRRYGMDAPTLPWIAGYVLHTGSISATRGALASAAAQTRELDGRALLTELPAGLRGFIVFATEGASGLF
jgi:hypothetical protein